MNGEGRFGETRGTTAGRFLRGKSAPVAGGIWDLLSGRTATGDKVLYQWGGDTEDKEVTLKDVTLNRVLPLITSDVKEAMKEQGVKALFTVGLPATFGVGVQTYK